MASPYKKLRLQDPNQIRVKLLIYYGFLIISLRGNLFLQNAKTGLLTGANHPQNRVNRPSKTNHRCSPKSEKTAVTLQNFSGLP